MAEDEGKAFLGTAVGEPVPGEHAFDGHNQTCTIGGESLEERVWTGFHVPVEHDLPLRVDDTDIQAPGM
jgi:hypothetical protein